jgi:hypothetical protein
MSLEGSEYTSQGGEVNSMDMLKSGTSFLSHDFKDTAAFAGSYAPIMKGVHQCGGKKKIKKTKRKTNKKNRTQKNRKNTRKNRKQKKRRVQKRKSKKNKKGGDSCNTPKV